MKTVSEVPPPARGRGSGRGSVVLPGLLSLPPTPSRRREGGTSDGEALPPPLAGEGRGAGSLPAPLAGGALPPPRAGEGRGGGGRGRPTPAVADEPEQSFFGGEAPDEDVERIAIVQQKSSLSSLHADAG